MECTNIHVLSFISSTGQHVVWDSSGCLATAVCLRRRTPSAALCNRMKNIHVQPAILNRQLTFSKLLFYRHVFNYFSYWKMIYEGKATFNLMLRHAIYSKLALRLQCNHIWSQKNLYNNNIQYCLKYRHDSIYWLYRNMLIPFGASLHDLSMSLGCSIQFASIREQARPIRTEAIWHSIDCNRISIHFPSFRWTLRTNMKTGKSYIIRMADKWMVFVGLQSLANPEINRCSESDI